LYLRRSPIKIHLLENITLYLCLRCFIFAASVFSVLYNIFMIFVIVKFDKFLIFVVVYNIACAVLCSIMNIGVVNSGNACYHSVQNLLSSRLLSKNINIRIYKTIILPVVLYGVKLGL
jgi:hypothetical protein